MKALSIRQPWAWAILNGKPVENRGWYTKYRGPVLIHASRTFDHDGYFWLMENCKLLSALIPPKSKFKMGGIIGKSNIIDCVDDHPSPFFFGKWGFVLDDSEPVDFHPCNGRLGLFDVPVWELVPSGGVKFV